MTGNFGNFGNNNFFNKFKGHISHKFLEGSKNKDERKEKDDPFTNLFNFSDGPKSDLFRSNVIKPKKLN